MNIKSKKNGKIYYKNHHSISEIIILLKKEAEAEAIKVASAKKS